MSSREMFSERAIQIIAEDKIRAAMNAGQFDNLPGFGQPSELIDEPYDPLWWVRRKLKIENLPVARPSVGSPDPTSFLARPDLSHAGRGRDGSPNLRQGIR